MSIANRFRSRAFLALLCSADCARNLRPSVCRGPDQDWVQHGGHGAFAGNGKAAATATQMWAEDQNAKGGLLGRPVELVFYDDQSNPSLVPGIYTKFSRRQSRPRHLRRRHQHHRPRYAGGHAT